MNPGQHSPRDGRGWSRGWQVWLGWVLASTLGWAVGGPAGIAAGPSGNIIAAGYTGVAAGGTLAGVLQWFVLRRELAGVGWWMAAGPAGAAVAGIVVFAGGGIAGADAAWVAGAGLCGPLVGLAQWRVLRRRVARAGWWVAASTGAWVAGGPGVGIAAAILNAAVNANGAWAALGIMYGVITGWVLVWLLRQPRPGGDNRAAIRPER